MIIEPFHLLDKDAEIIWNVICQGRGSQFRLGKEDPIATNLSLSKFARSASE
jgi:hypothetical protein